MKILIGLGVLVAAVAIALYLNANGVKTKDVNWNSIVKTVRQNLDSLKLK